MRFYINNSKVIGITSRVSFSVSMSDTSTHEVVALWCGIESRALLAGSVLEDKNGHKISKKQYLVP